MLRPLRKYRANLAVSAITVIGKRVDEDGDIAGPNLHTRVPHHFAAKFAVPRLNGAFDIVTRHADGAGLVDGVAELEVGFGMRRVSRRDDDILLSLLKSLAR